MSEELKPITELDYEIFRNKKDGNEWQVWTPDSSGACIGHGKTRREAIYSTMSVLKNTADKIANDLLA